MIAGIILAAGQSKRMGEQKLLLPFDNKTIIEKVVEVVVSSHIDKVYLVISQDIIPVKEKLTPQVETVLNLHPEYGLSYSIRLGLKALEKETIGFGLFLGDKPLLTLGEINDLLEQFVGMLSNKSILVPRFDGKIGHPVFFDIKWKSNFFSITGDQGGRTIISKNKNEVFFVKGKSSGALDIDTYDDYQSIIENKRC